MNQGKMIFYLLTILCMYPIIKTEITTGPRGGQGNHTEKTTLFDPIQMANLQECYGHRRDETEYLWHLFNWRRLNPIEQ